MYIISFSLRELGEVVDPEPILPMKKSGAGDERAQGHRARRRWLGVESAPHLTGAPDGALSPLCVSLLFTRAFVSIMRQ